MIADALAPITHERFLRCDPGRAFATYTGRISEWWDPRYTANDRAKFGDWPIMLDRFAALADADAA